MRSIEEAVAAEREACAILAESGYKGEYRELSKDDPLEEWVFQAQLRASLRIAREIRARSTHPE